MGERNTGADHEIINQTEIHTMQIKHGDAGSLRRICRRHRIIPGKHVCTTQPKRFDASRS